MNVFATALSGMQAAQAQLNATANNLANLQTPGYKAQRVNLTATSTEGVAVANISRDTTPGPTLPDGEEGSNVDLATEAVNLTRSQLLYSANAAVVRVGNQMMGSLLDMFDNEDHEHHGA